MSRPNKIGVTPREHIIGGEMITFGNASASLEKKPRYPLKKGELSEIIDTYFLDKDTTELSPAKDIDRIVGDLYSLYPDKYLPTQQLKKEISKRIRK